MKKILIALLSLFALHADAKVYPLMGVIVDAKGKEVSPLSVVIKGSKGVSSAFLKKGGLYYSDTLPEGAYQVTVNFAATSYTAKVVLRAPDAGKKPVFYNFKVAGKQLVAFQGNEDPFATAALNEVKENSFNIDGGPGLFYDAPQDFSPLPKTNHAASNFRVLPDNSDSATERMQRRQIINNSPVYWDFVKQPKR